MNAARRFKSIFTDKRLRKIYADSIRHKEAIGIDRIKPNQLQHSLGTEVALIAAKAHSGTYRYTAYKEKLISKGQGKSPRVISIPTARDRIVLRGLCELLVDTFPQAKTTLPQVAIQSLQTALASGKYGEYIKLDIQEFYPSINHDVLLKALKKKIRKPELLALLRGAIQTPTVPASKGSKGSLPNGVGVPQGLAVSNQLAEICLQPFDTLFKGRPDLWYCRYVDDILILVPTGAAASISNEVIASLTGLGLKVHSPSVSGSKSKIAPMSEPFSFLGYEIAKGKITIRKDSVHKFEASLANIFTHYRHRLLKATNAQQKANAIDVCRWRLNLRITGCIFEGRRLGWVFYFSQVTTTERLRAINKTVRKLLQRFNLVATLNPKSLIKTYYESMRKNKGTHGYIPNFDTMPVAEQRAILSMLLGAQRIRGLSDKRIQELFKMRIRVAVRELEADLAGLS